MNNFFGRVGIIFSDIKIQHTVFALPFAVMSAFMAAEGMPEWEALFWILVCMFGARNAAMVFNRIVDAGYDRLNPRTESRPLAARAINVGSYWVFLVLSSVLFVFASYMLNQLAFFLSPLALIIVFFYSFTKRFTVFSHIFLGLALSIAPIGAWIAIREEISLASIILGAAVVFWLTGFDIIYSCQDVESDTQTHLYSIPRRFGLASALKFAAVAHTLMVVFLLVLLEYSLLGYPYLVGIILVAGLLIYEHSLIKPDDLSKLNIAFFNVNGFISILLMTLVIVDCVWV